MDATPVSVSAADFLSVALPALETSDAGQAAQAILGRWQPRELTGFLGHPDADVRRVTAVMLGLVGDHAMVGCLARALKDPDDQVNEMAEHGLWSIWFRLCKRQTACAFARGVQMIAEENYLRAIDLLSQVVQADPEFAEGYHQRAIARFFVGYHQDAVDDCRRTVRLMPVHFGAVAGMGHGYVELGRLDRAIGCYRRALQINPRMHELAQTLQELQGVELRQSVLRAAPLVRESRFAQRRM